MAVQIFQTSVLFLLIFLVVIHTFSVDEVPEFVVAVVVIGLFLSLATTFVSTVILIWT